MQPPFHYRQFLTSGKPCAALERGAASTAKCIRSFSNCKGNLLLPVGKLQLFTPLLTLKLCPHKLLAWQAVQCKQKHFKMLLQAANFLLLITYIYILLGVNRASSIYRHNSEEIHEANSRFNMASKTAEKSLWDTCGPYKTINISKQMLAEHLWLQIHNIQELAKAVWKSLQLQHWPCTDETLSMKLLSQQSPHMNPTTSN